jgi:xanthine dehydrogenase small subunit
VEIESDKISNIRTGFGGMAATPKRALVCEKALIGEPWKEETMVSAASAVIEDFQPIDDHRASKHYRLRVAGNLFTRLYRDIANVEDVIEVMAS